MRRSFYRKDRECVHDPKNPFHHLSDARHKQWVSLKIIAADSSRKSRELRNLQQGSLSSNYIVQLLDSFAHQGSNGLHQCLCLVQSLKRLHGSTISLKKVQSLKPETILRMSKQLRCICKIVPETCLFGPFLIMPL
jgi:hypothetical protein